MQQTIRLLRALPEPEPPPMIAANVMRRIRAGETRPSFFGRIQRALGGVLEPSFVLPASAMAVAALVIFAIQDGGRLMRPLDWTEGSTDQSMPQGSGEPLAANEPMRAAPSSTGGDRSQFRRLGSPGARGNAVPIAGLRPGRECAGWQRRSTARGSAARRTGVRTRTSPCAIPWRLHRGIRSRQDAGIQGRRALRRRSSAIRSWRRGLSAELRRTGCDFDHDRLRAACPMRPGPPCLPRFHAGPRVRGRAFASRIRAERIRATCGSRVRSRIPSSLRTSSRATIWRSRSSGSSVSRRERCLGACSRSSSTPCVRQGTTRRPGWPTTFPPNRRPLRRRRPTRAMPELSRSAKAVVVPTSSAEFE